MIAYATANVALSLWCVHLRERLKRRRKFHHTVALLVWSIFVQTAGCVLGLVHWSVFSRDGVGSPATLQTSVFLRHAADLLVVLLVVLLAKGWTIVRRKLSANGRVRVALYMTVLAGAGFNVASTWVSSKRLAERERHGTRRGRPFEMIARPKIEWTTTELRPF